MIKQYNAYWLHNKGQLINVPSTHIEQMRKEPKTFGTDLKTIDSLYDKYGEKYNVEGKARREAMISAIEKGWIRLRKHVRSGTWYANVNKLDNKNMKALQNWMGDMIDAGYEYKTTPIIISDVLDGVGKMKKITSENKAMELKTTFGEVLNENYSDTSLKNILKESGLSRVKSHMEKHDCGIITAFRGADGCAESSDTKFTKSDNMKRNKQLLAKLESKGYGTTKVKGSYIENFGTDEAKEVGEWSWFVVDLKDKGNLYKDLLKLGEYFMQDSILWIPKGGTYAELVSSNKCPKGYPGRGKVGVKQKFGSPGMGKTGEFFTRVNGRGFNFKNVNEIMESEVSNYFESTNWLGKMGTKSTADLKDWRDVEL